LVADDADVSVVLEGALVCMPVIGPGLNMLLLLVVVAAWCAAHSVAAFCTSVLLVVVVVVLLAAVVAVAGMGVLLLLLLVVVWPVRGGCWSPWGLRSPSCKLISGWW
jgi:hypothetical protein